MREVPNADDVLAAADVVNGIARATPLTALAGTGLLLKCESQQVTGSFKLRGAVAAVAAAAASGVAHVVAGSSGNHGIALAHAAAARGIKATVFMTRSSSMWKRERIRREGAEVVLCDHGNDQRDQAAREHAARTGAMFVSSHDDAAVIAGQGTVAMEVLQQAPEVTHIFVPVGGGGLLAGTCLVAGATGVRVIGVEPVGADRYTRSLRVGRPVRLDRVSTACDGVRAQTPGRLSFACVRDTVHRMVTVTDAQVFAAMTQLATAGLPCEVTGALAVAGALSVGIEPGATAVAVVSGANSHMVTQPGRAAISAGSPAESSATGVGNEQVQKI
ncbi:pyridoxal-phosphate dependent enzyme [Micromonospora sp. AMSO12t]|uniref:threonine ammonia-lyase n=1 Tax=unclassified Micromonospora TaxID=2617518 RepID=UPI00124B14E5|nr:pyridoxal-phosphate dependent enzyme [Micromonospora sp. AMSO12t]KAB1162083.1 pyridoxal-phosphate dependent enzyme [Micromonospora sp. AMSO12t]